MVNHSLKVDYNITDLYFDSQNKLNLSIDKELNSSNVKMLYAILDTLDDVANVYDDEVKSLNINIDYINGSKEFTLKPNKQEELSDTDVSSITIFPDEDIMLSNEFGAKNMLLPFLMFGLVILSCIFGFALKRNRIKNKMYK